MIFDTSMAQETSFLTYVARLSYQLGVRRIFTVKDRFPSVAQNFVQENIAWVEAETDAAAFTLAREDHAAGGIDMFFVGSDAPWLESVFEGCLRDPLPLIVVQLLPSVEASKRERRLSWSKGTFEMNPDNAGTVLGKAAALSRLEPVGAVHLRIHFDPYLENTVSTYRPRAVQVVTPTLRKRDPAIGEICRMLRKATRPLIIFGSEGVRANAATSTLDLAGVLDSPILITNSMETSLRQKGETLILCRGRSNEIDDKIDALAARADFLIFVGLGPEEMGAWAELSCSYHVVIVLTACIIDNDLRHVDLLFLADVGEATAALAAGFSPRLNWPDGETRKLHGKLPVKNPIPARR